MAPMAPGKATPGFSPPCSPDTPPQQETNAEPLPWQDARPPSSVPGERNSWLFVPLLHAAAGNLTERANQAWRDCPGIGPRFGELVALLRDAPPVMPTTLARTLLAVAECDAHDGARHVMQEDVETATALTGMPDAPVPLAAAILLCMAPDGYLTAATQSALLESYAGAMAAAAARSLADDSRRTPDANEPVATTRRRRRRARRHSAPREDPHPPPSASDEHSGVPTCPAAADELGAVPTAQPAGIPATAWAALDAVDLVAELQNPVPTLQDVPPFMRAAVRGALVTALSRLRSDYATATAGDYAATSRAWKLFLLSPRMLLARPAHQGADGRAELLERAALSTEATGCSFWKPPAPTAGRPWPAPPWKQRRSRRDRACAKVRMGELTRARQVLTASELAPGDEATFRALTDPLRRPPEPRAAIPAEALQPSTQKA